MRIDILTLFPETLGDVLSESILGRAQERGFIRMKPTRSGIILPTSRIRWTTIPTVADAALS